MSKEYEVRWSTEAIYDVADIEDYIEDEFGWERAEKFHDDINAAGAALGTQYKMSSGTGILYRGLVIRKRIISPSIIFYCFDSSQKMVYVLRVLRHERNWQKMLRENITID